MREVDVRYTAEFYDTIEVPDDWEWDGSLDSLLDHTDLPYGDGTLLDWWVG